MEKPSIRCGGHETRSSSKTRDDLCFSLSHASIRNALSKYYHISRLALWGLIVSVFAWAQIRSARQISPRKFTTLYLIKHLFEWDIARRDEVFHRYDLVSELAQHADSCNAILL
jgi:hypothetical protein